MSFATGVSNLIARFGGSMTLHHRTGGTYNPATRTYTGGTSTPTVLSAAVTPAKKEDAGDVQPGDLEARVTAAALGATVPTPSDLVEIGSATYRVIRVDTVMPAGAAVAYVLHLRGVE